MDGWIQVSEVTWQMKRKGLDTYLWKAVLRIYDEETGLSATTVSYLEAMSRWRSGEAGSD